MPGSGDDEHDDEGLTSSLRSVWLAMPDEEPPESGLAALMAAAREKASEMAASSSATATAVADETARCSTAAATEAARPPAAESPAPRGPSLWQRLSMILRRPPVFALASVALVVGSLVILGQRTDQRERDAPSVHAERQTTAARAEPFADQGELADHASGIEVAGEVDGVTASRADEQAATAEPTPTVQRAPKVQTTRTAQAEHTTRTTKTAKSEMPPQAEQPENTAQTARLDAAQTAELQGARTATSDDAATSPETLAGRRGAASTAEAAAHPDASTTSAPALVTLQAQARAAAAAGNCAAIRPPLEQIARRDAALARRMRAEPAIARCLGTH